MKSKGALPRPSVQEYCDHINNVDNDDPTAKHF